jgi:hypothetical protein
VRNFQAIFTLILSLTFLNPFNIDIRRLLGCAERLSEQFADENQQAHYQPQTALL